MKTVEEKAKDYAHKLRREIHDIGGSIATIAYKTYVDATNEANKWISVKDELPPFEDVPIDERTKYLTKVRTGSISSKIDVRIGCLSNHRKWIGEMDWVTVTHWRPIN